MDPIWLMAKVFLIILLFQHHYGHENICVFRDLHAYTCSGQKSSCETQLRQDVNSPGYVPNRRPLNFTSTRKGIEWEVERVKAWGQ